LTAALSARSGAARDKSGGPAVIYELVPLLYEDLRRIARKRLRFDRNALTLGTTALVNAPE